MLTKKTDGDALSQSTRWINADHSAVIGAQFTTENGRAFVHLGHPLLGMQLTADEALTVAEEFAPTLAILHADMRTYLEALRYSRGGK
jgi:hypothetical protein